MPRFRSSILVGALLLAVCELACADRPAPAERPPEDESPGPAPQELLNLPVKPGEVVMADRPVPIGLPDPPCIVPVIQGIGRYADVGWVSPRFFIVRASARDTGYTFQPIGSGRERFAARFRSPRSEAEAEALNGSAEVPFGVSRLFCDVPATLAQVQRSGIRRLAMWPVDAFRAAIRLRGVTRQMAVQPGLLWNNKSELSASIDLSPEEARELRRDLASILGAQFEFFVSSRWRRTGCLQTVNLGGVGGIDEYGLRDGESGAVALSSVKLVSCNCGS